MVLHFRIHYNIFQRGSQQPAINSVIPHCQNLCQAAQGKQNMLLIKNTGLYKSQNSFYPILTERGAWGTTVINRDFPIGDPSTCVGTRVRLPRNLLEKLKVPKISKKCEQKGLKWLFCP